MMDDCFSLMHKEWEEVPCSQRSQDNQNKVFIVLARSAVGAHSLHRRNQNYPGKALAVPWFPGLAGEVEGERHCRRRMDPWSAAFFDANPDIYSQQTQTQLIAANTNARKETLRVEKRNGYVRLFLTGASNMRKTVDLSLLNQWLASEQVKEDAREVEKSEKQLTKQQHEKPIADKEDALKKKRNCRTGTCTSNRKPRASHMLNGRLGERFRKDTRN